MSPERQTINGLSRKKTPARPLSKRPGRLTLVFAAGHAQFAVQAIQEGGHHQSALTSPKRSVLLPPAAKVPAGRSLELLCASLRHRCSHSRHCSLRHCSRYRSRRDDDGICVDGRSASCHRNRSGNRRNRSCHRSPSPPHMALRSRCDNRRCDSHHCGMRNDRRNGNHCGDGAHRTGDRGRRLAIRSRLGQRPVQPDPGSSETDFDSSKYLL